MFTILLTSLLLACHKDDDGLIRPINHGGDDSAGATELTGDSAYDISNEDGGGGEDTFNATWVRCEQGGEIWTFHAELNYAARRVDVESGVGTTVYEMWYLSAQDDTNRVWEVTISDGYSTHTCDEIVPLVWTASGWADWEVQTDSEYTPP